jgi:hypothetical protein
MGVIARGRIVLGRHPLPRSTRRTAAEAAIVLAAAVVGIVIGASLERSHTSTDTATPPATAVVPKPAAKPVPNTGIVASATPSTLRALSNALGRPLYWSGPQPGYKYELTLTPTAQRVYLRYLPPGVPLGSPRASFLSIGTYRVQNAVAALQTQARKPGGVSLRLPHGAVGYYSSAKPTSVYLAYPRTDEQIEVFDPVPSVALQTAKSGSIRPVP